MILERLIMQSPMLAMIQQFRNNIPTVCSPPSRDAPRDPCTWRLPTNKDQKPSALITPPTKTASHLIPPPILKAILSL
ncbi:hypothetical protein CEXT_639582 [Caerostris extrusa]|uniref:Uncharacterized protein n=1 Tax=Caerostris extrusa TaxID=172846 RepID=A0AAV4U2S2_CAEEX|nr:hypothetical protein CEXT_639582 [Caerostris extrusa]